MTSQSSNVKPDAVSRDLGGGTVKSGKDLEKGEVERLGVSRRRHPWTKTVRAENPALCGQLQAQGSVYIDMREKALQHQDARGT